HTRFSRDWSSDVCSSDLLDLAWVGHGGRVRRDAEDERRDDDGRQPWVGGLDFIQGSEQPADPRQGDGGLLCGLPHGGGEQILVLGVTAAAGERNVAGPRIRLVFGTLDEEQLERLPGSQDERDGGLDGVRGARDARRGASLQRAAEQRQTGVVDYHTRRLPPSRGHGNAGAAWEHPNVRRVPSV